MQNQPIRDQRILEALEVCRPGSTDKDDPGLAPLAAEMAANPELAAVYERLQQVDAELSVAFRDVPVPEGLDRRTLERLSAARPRGVSRRWLLAAGGALSAAAALLIAAWMGSNQPPDYEPDNAQVDAAEFFNNESPQEAFDAPAPRGYPISRAVVQGHRVQWRRVSGFLGRNGVAYELSGPGNVRATLYVIRYRMNGAAGAPALRPFSTAGCCVSMWQEGKLLYVLVVGGSARAYHSHLDLGGPVA